MDSGNSGSLQSSSGGEDDFDSRGGGGGVDSSPLSALLRPAPSASTGAFSLHGSLYGLQEEFGSAAPPQQQSHQAGLWPGSFTGAAGASSSSSPCAPGADHGARQQAETSAPAPRGSRKRTRASRRAPTTVLTTDISNFRAMVQEFTGIPSPPFATAPGPAALRTHFDHIFTPPSSLLRSAAASLPPYLLRPFAQKLASTPSAFPPFTTSSSSSPLSSSIGVANANATTGALNTAAGASSNPTAQTGAADTFQLSSSALLRLHDPSSYLSFQNLFDSQPASQSIFGEAGGFGHPQAPRMHESTPSPSEFLAGIGGGNLGLTHSGLMGSDGIHLQHPRSDVQQHGGDELSGVVASGGSCKLNYSTHAGAASSSSAAASGDKPPDAGAPGSARPARGEGLDPWICTSE
jgi:hypothetical protein